MNFPEPSTMLPESAANFQFHYETSSVNPKIDNLETSTMRHFSFGNLGDNSGEYSNKLNNNSKNRAIELNFQKLFFWE